MPHPLYRNFTTQAETDIQQLWLHEARSRADEIDADNVQLVSGEQLEQEVRTLFT